MPPPRTRQYLETAATRELATRIARREDLIRRLAEAEEKVWEQAIVVAREKNKVTIAELARRVGYSREHVSGIVSKANKRDGWTEPSET